MRSSLFDVGCDEINGTGNSMNGVLDSTLVGARLNIQKNQTISFPSIPSKTFGNPDFSPGATANSGLAVSYSSSNTAVASIINNMIHIVGAGTAIITASQAGNTQYLPAPSVSQTLTVSKANQTITFATLSNKSYGSSDYSPGAISSSGLSISYTSSKTSVATIVNSMIHIVGVGSSNITASQSGNSNYNAASSVVRTLNVVKADQIITFPPIPSKALGSADFSPGATSSSGLTIKYTSSNTSVATIFNSKIRIVGLGSCNITASQSGNTYYNAAQNVVQPFTVTSTAGSAAMLITENNFLGGREYLYPNPAITQSHFHFLIRQNGIIKLRLYTISGEMVRDISNGYMNAGEHTIDIEVGNLSSGIYILQLTEKRRTQNFRLMVKNL